MKKCNQCKKEKGLQCFYRSAYTKDGYRRNCKDCAKENNKHQYNHTKQEYKNNPLYIKKERVNKYTREFYYKVKDFTNKVRSDLGCAICCEKELVCLDFHHKNGNKEVLVCSQHSYKGAIREMIKCVVLCANCHRKVHAGLLNIDDKPTLDQQWLESRVPYTQDGLRDKFTSTLEKSY